MPFPSPIYYYYYYYSQVSFFFLSLRKLLKWLERIIKIIKKFWGNIVLENLEERSAEVNMLVQFSFLTLKKSGSGTICNNNKKVHHNKKILYKNRFQRRYEFQTRSATREGFRKKWLPIFKEKRSRFNRMMRLSIFFTPTEQSYNNNLKNILLYTSSRKGGKKMGK